MAAVTEGYEILHKIADALGLEGQPIRRIIIDCSIDDALRVHVEKFADKGEADALVEALKGATAEVSNAADVRTQAGFTIHQKVIP